MPKINNFTPEQQEIINKLWPIMEKLVREVNDADEELCFTGFLYGGDREHPMLVHLSNISDRGEELVIIHYSLATMAAALEMNTEQYERLEINPAPNTLSSEEVADKLALKLLQMGFNEQSGEIREILQEYLNSRKK